MPPKGNRGRSAGREADAVVSKPRQSRSSSARGQKGKGGGKGSGSDWEDWQGGRWQDRHNGWDDEAPTPPRGRGRRQAEDDGKGRSSSMPAGRGPQAKAKAKASAKRSSSAPPDRPSQRKADWGHPDGLPLEELEEGSVLPGVVVNSSQFGVFADIGAECNARVTMQRIYWRKFARGDHLDECIVQTVDLERRRIAITIEDPQGTIAGNRTSLEELRPGMVVEGVIDHKNKFGVWVNVFAECMGRLNVPRKFTQKLLNGQVVRNIVIESVDLEKRKLGLTLDDPEAAVADELVLVGVPPLEPNSRRLRSKAKSKAKAKPKAKAAQALPQAPPAPAGAPPGLQVGDWVNGTVMSIASRGVMVDIGLESPGTLLVSAELKSQMQKGDQIQGMKVEKVARNGAINLSMEDPTLEIDEEPAPVQGKPKRKPQARGPKPGPPADTKSPREARSVPKGEKGSGKGGGRR